MILQLLRISFPRWDIGPSDAGPVWEALIRPTPTSLHVLIAPTLPELGAKLARAELHVPPRGAEPAPNGF